MGDEDAHLFGGLESSEQLFHRQQVLRRQELALPVLLLVQGFQLSEVGLPVGEEVVNEKVSEHGMKK